jgi:hypothetical protein
LRGHHLQHEESIKLNSLGILKSLYPRVDLDAVGEGFVASCIEEEANDLVQSFIETASQVIEMIPVDMS